jgi:hypothetical protein
MICSACLLGAASPAASIVPALFDASLIRRKYTCTRKSVSSCNNYLSLVKPNHGQTDLVDDSGPRSKKVIIIIRSACGHQQFKPDLVDFKFGKVCIST